MANTGFISLAPEIAAVNAAIVAHRVATDATGVIVENVHDVDLPAVKTETALIVDDTNELQLERKKRDNPKLASDDNGLNNIYEDIINISDKGIMFGISCTLGGVASFGSIKIIIDTVTIIERFHFVEENADGQGHASLSMWLPFETSLQVQHKKAIAGGNIYSIVSYSID